MTYRKSAIAAALTLAIMACNANAQFMPPAGYSGGSGPHVLIPSDPDAPLIKRVPNATMSSLIHVNGDYKRGSAVSRARVVGVFTIAETRKVRLVAAWSPGFLPVTLSFSDGRCYALQADYEGGTLSNGRLKAASCENRRVSGITPSSPPPGRTMRFIGTAWGYGAWSDHSNKTTVVTAPGAKTFQPLFTANMPSSAIMAMNGIDWPGGNVTLVGKIKGQLTVVTLEVEY